MMDDRGSGTRRRNHRRAVKTIANWPREHVRLWCLSLVHPTPNAARTLMFGSSLHTDIAIAERYWPKGDQGTPSSWSTAR